MKMYETLAAHVEDALTYAEASDLPRLPAPITLMNDMSLDLLDEGISYPPSIDGWACAVLSSDRIKNGWTFLSGQSRVSFTKRRRVVTCGRIEVTPNGTLRRDYVRDWIYDKVWTTRDLTGFRNKEITKGRHTYRATTIPADEKVLPMMCAGILNTQLSAWNVTFKTGPTAKNSLHLPTTPEGILEIFKLREKPEGRTRRSALLHIVSSHTRRPVGSSPDVEATIQVRKHLRGNLFFDWFGMLCTVSPSRKELELL